MKKFLHQRKNSLGFAWEGLVYFFRNEVHARIHLTFTVVVLFMGWFCSISAREWMMLMVCIALVVQAELWNTVFEKLLDFVSPQYDSRVKIMKDMAAAAVFWCAAISVVIGLMVFMPYITAWF